MENALSKRARLTIHILSVQKLDCEVRLATATEIVNEQ
jgi:hypothetical protein